VYLFGDSFDLYASASDTTALGQYWDTYPLVGYYNLTAGRYTGSQAITGVFGGAQATLLSKASGSNDAVHHVVIAAMQPGALSGTSYYGTITLWDGTTAQCTIGFRSDGAIVLVSGISTSGTVLATYTGAITAAAAARNLTISFGARTPPRFLGSATSAAMSAGQDRTPLSSSRHHRSATSPCNPGPRTEQGPQARTTPVICPSSLRAPAS